MSVSCWCPAYFAQIHIDYTNKICRQHLLSGKTYTASALDYMVENDAEHRRKISNKIKILQDNADDQMKPVLLAQVTVALVGYLILTKVK